jgi:two-component system, OmpR family, sensor histidine kinase VanS
MLALFCFAVIFLLSFLILKADSEKLFNGVLGTALKWLSNRIFPLAPLLFIFCIIAIIYFQRRQLIAYLATLSANFETISLEDQEKQRFPLPGILKDTEESIERLQLALREKEQARKEIEQRKNDLIVYLAHDLKTPISSIIGYLTLLRDERSISDEMHQKFIQVTLHNAERLDDLINEFFEITRFNLANVSLNYSKVNISFMLEYYTGQIINKSKMMKWQHSAENI